MPALFVPAVSVAAVHRRVGAMVSTRSRSTLRSASASVSSGDADGLPDIGRASRGRRAVRKPSQASRIAQKDAQSPKKPQKALNKAEDVSSAANAKHEDGAKKYYLLKSEPESRIEKGVEMKFSIDDLAERPDQTEPWDGVRNYEARNTMQRMRVGDLGFFYVRREQVGATISEQGRAKFEYE